MDEWVDGWVEMRCEHLRHVDAQRAHPHVERRVRPVPTHVGLCRVGEARPADVANASREQVRRLPVGMHVKEQRSQLKGWRSAAAAAAAAAAAVGEEGAERQKRRGSMGW